MRRLMLDISLAQLANSVGTTPRELRLIEQGDIRPEPMLLNRILDQLGVGIHWCLREFGRPDEAATSDSSPIEHSDGDEVLREEALRLLDKFLQIQHHGDRSCILDHAQRLAYDGKIS